LSATISAEFYAPPGSLLGCGDAITFTPPCQNQSWVISGVR
jgi:hypothetical protein